MAGGGIIVSVTGGTASYEGSGPAILTVTNPLPKLIRAIHVSYMTSDPNLITNPIYGRVVIVRDKVNRALKFDPALPGRALGGGYEDLEEKGIAYDVRFNALGYQQILFDSGLEIPEDSFSIILCPAYDMSKPVVTGTYTPLNLCLNVNYDLQRDGQKAFHYTAK